MKDIRPYLEHILQECDFLTKMSTKMNYEEFLRDPMATRAFVRSLEVIGEAVKQLPQTFRKKHPYIPWREIAGMRDKLIHEYFGINYAIVWETVVRNIPELHKQIERIIKEEGGSHTQ